MSIINLMNQNSEKYRNKYAIIDDNNSSKITFDEFERDTEIIADYLSEKGLKSGDTILIFVPMSIALYELMASFFRLGIAVIFVDPHAGLNYINMCCKLIRPTAIIASRLNLLIFHSSSEIRKISKKITLEKIIKIKRIKESYQNIDNENNLSELAKLPALITFTSGTTGIPKIIVRTQEFLLEQHKSIEKSLNVSCDWTMMTSLPIFLLSHIATGMTVIIPKGKWREPKNINSEDIYRQILFYGCDTIVASPILIDKLSKYLLNDKIVKRIFMGGSAVLPNKIIEYKKIKDVDINIIYGASEAEPISECNIKEIDDEKIFDMLDGKGLYVGKFVDSIKYKVIRSDTDLVSILSDNQEGELIVSGKHVLKGYLNGIGDKENKITIDDEIWHRTGDYGYVVDGQFWLLGKVKSIIRINDRIISPFSIEARLSVNEEIEKSTVIEYVGKVYIVIQLKSKILKLSREYEKKIRDQLENIGKHQIILVKEIPTEKRHSSKINREKLLEILKKRVVRQYICDKIIKK